MFLVISTLIVPTARSKSQEITEQAIRIQNEEIKKLEEEKAREIERQKIEAKNQRINETFKLLTAKAHKLVGTKQGQCVIAVRNFLGVGRDQIQGYVQMKVNSFEPQVGNIIMIVGRMRHSGVVLYVNKDMVAYYDSNYKLDGRAGIRTIKVNDKKIKGYRDTGIFDL